MQNRQIILLRHGRSTAASSARLNASEFRAWVREYEQASIAPQPAPPVAAIDRAKTADLVVSSPSPRCLASATALGLAKPAVIDAVFGECEMPSSTGTRVRLPVSAWSFLHRLQQLAGRPYEAESYQDIKQRSSLGAARLEALTQNHKTILLIGHGAMNWLIQRQLMKRGWRSNRRLPARCWQQTILSS